MHEVSFWEASKALFDYRDHLRKIAADWTSLEMAKEPIFVLPKLTPDGVSMELQPCTVPPLPGNIAEALRFIEADILRLRQHFHERDMRRHYELHGA